MSTVSESQSSATASWEVRDRLVHALNLDLVGPWAGHPHDAERLPGWIRPSNWYLTGFLIPSSTEPELRSEGDEDDELDETPEESGLAEESAEERRAAKRAFFPSSIGLSFLMSKDTDSLDVTVRWGDYEHAGADPEEAESLSAWQRIPRAETVRVVPLGAADYLVPDSAGLELHVVERPVNTQNIPDMPSGTRSVSVFLVNRRRPVPANRDSAYAFQAEIEVRGQRPFVPRFDLTGALASDWDERVADLHYADSPEYATGHGISADWDIVDGECRSLRTTWIPSGEVAKTDTVEVPGAELSMDALGEITRRSRCSGRAPAVGGRLPRLDRLEACQCCQLGPDPERDGGGSPAPRRHRCRPGRARVSRHWPMIPTPWDAFRVSNRAVARALRQRLQGLFADSPPSWRAFQLAFFLLNLPGVIDPTDPDRESVDLLFFPTGGGKTEAYLGLAAFTMVLRRLRNPALDGFARRGVTVIMRYTLRLLTLDQLSRASDWSAPWSWSGGPGPTDTANGP